MKTKSLPLITGILTLAWVFGLVVSYYIFHKPFGSDFALSLVTSILRLIGAALLIAAGGGLGRRIVLFREFHPLTRITLQAGLGCGILALVFLGVGLVGGVRSWTAWLLLGIIFVVNFRFVRSWTIDFYAGLRESRPGNRFEVMLCVYIGFILLAGLFKSLAPPIKFDALVYHLAIPSQYIIDGRIGPILNNQYAGMPQIGEMLYTWSGLLGGMRAAAVTGWGLSALAVMGLIGYCSKKLGSRAGWLAGALILSGYSLAVSISTAYVDWVGFVYGLCVLVVLSEWATSRSNSMILLAGIFAGLGWGTKYTAGILIPAGLAMIVLIGIRSRVRWVTPAMIFTLSAFFVMAPWFLKNLFFYGNPLAPIALLKTSEASGQQIFQQTLPFGNLLDLFLLPLRATIIGREGGEGYDYSIGPLLFGFAGLAWLSWKSRGNEEKDTILQAGIFTIAGIIIWAIANQISGFLIVTRMYLPIFPGLAVLASMGFVKSADLVSGGIRWGRLITSLAVLVLALNTLEVATNLTASGAVQSWLGMMNDQDYLERNLGWNSRAMSAVSDLPAGSKTQLLLEPRSLYCLPDCIPDETLSKFKAAYQTTGSTSGVINAWKDEGISYILLYKSGEEYFRQAGDPHHPVDELDLMNEMLVQLPAPVDYGGTYLLYQIP